MSHENKVGIVLAGSFLGLVGLVLHTRMKEREVTGKPETEAFAQASLPETQTHPGDATRGHGSADEVPLTRGGQQEKATPPRTLPPVKAVGMTEVEGELKIDPPPRDGSPPAPVAAVEITPGPGTPAPPAASIPALPGAALPPAPVFVPPTVKLEPKPLANDPLPGFPEEKPVAGPPMEVPMKEKPQRHPMSPLPAPSGLDLPAADPKGPPAAAIPKPEGKLADPIAPPPSPVPVPAGPEGKTFDPIRPPPLPETGKPEVKLADPITPPPPPPAVVAPRREPLAPPVGNAVMPPAPLGGKPAAETSPLGAPMPLEPRSVPGGVAAPPPPRFGETVAPLGIGPGSSSPAAPARPLGSAADPNPVTPPRSRGDGRDSEFITTPEPPPAVVAPSGPTAMPPPIAAPPAPTSSPLPPLGSLTTAATPPLVVAGGERAKAAGTPSRAAVTDWVEEDYLVRQGDTYESISKVKLQSEKYAEALKQYNQNHPILGGDVRKFGLVPGLKIAVPSAGLLEQRYGAAIPGLNGGSHATAPGPTGPAALAPATIATSTPTAGAAQAPRTARYLVKANNEFLRDIAGSTLNSRERWTEIANLNPGIDPLYPVPAGKVVNLPAEARVPTANVPQ